MKRGLIILFFLIMCIGVSAEDININIPRGDYSVGETFQAEIFFNIDVLNEVTVSNFELRNFNNAKIAIPLFLEKLGNNYYFVYFNLPDVEKGEYKFKVKDISYVDQGVLKETSGYENININSVNNGFSYLVGEQNSDGSFDNIKETSLAALALKNTYYEEAEDAISYLINNQDSTGCYPKNSCNIEDTSFALLSLYKFNKNIIKTKNWLKDASNNFDIGTWDLILNGNSNCNVNNEDFVVNGEIGVEITNKDILVNCTSNVSLKLMHGYLGNSYEIFNENAKYKEYSIDAGGCYGFDYKGSCDYEMTGYADWVLEEIGESPSLTWLENNARDTETLDYALLYLIKGDSYSYDWLMNNLQVNYWSDKSASLNQEPDNYVSAFAAYGLDELNVKDYLKDKTNLNVLNSGLILYLLFNDERNLPSISINPGIVNKLNMFSLNIKNNGDPIDIEIIAPNFTGLPSNVLLETELNYILSGEESYNIEIVYGNYSYLIPVLAENVTESLILLPPSKDSIVLLYVPEIVNETLLFDDKVKDSIFFKNNWGFSLHNISFVLTGNLNEIIRLDKYNYGVIEANETLEQIMWINEDKNPGEEYSGYLIVTSEEGTFVSLPIILYFTLNEEEITMESDLEDVEEENVTGEEDVGGDDDKGGDEKKSKAWLWIIPLVLIVIIGVVLFFFRGGKEVKTFDQYIKGVNR